MHPSEHASYVGGELDLFSAARNWKAYWGALIAPHIRGHVLEVGAGIGANTRALTSLAGVRFSSWTALEPDGALCDRMRASFSEPGLSSPVTVAQGTLATLPRQEPFDTVLYLDVLEHIEDDQAEVERAAARLAPGASLVVLSPAHNALYSPFDRAIGHFRRYDKRGLRAAGSTSPLREVSVRYLDSGGILLSGLNRFAARKSLPTERDIKVWDNLVVPVSRRLDPMLGYRLGKSILGIWSRL